MAALVDFSVSTVNSDYFVYIRSGHYRFNALSRVEIVRMAKGCPVQVCSHCQCAVDIFLLQLSDDRLYHVWVMVYRSGVLHSRYSALYYQKASGV